MRWSCLPVRPCIRIKIFENGAGSFCFLLKALVHLEFVHSKVYYQKNHHCIKSTTNHRVNMFYLLNQSSCPWPSALANLQNQHQWNNLKFLFHFSHANTHRALHYLVWENALWKRNWKKLQWLASERKQKWQHDEVALTLHTVAYKQTLNTSSSLLRPLSLLLYPAGSGAWRWRAMMKPQALAGWRGGELLLQKKSHSFLKMCSVALLRLLLMENVYLISILEHVQS